MRPPRALPSVLAADQILVVVPEAEPKRRAPSSQTQQQPASSRIGPFEVINRITLGHHYSSTRSLPSATVLSQYYIPCYTIV
ncbi:hypothetical protein WAI453_008832 [Rhynchosporium graminicola]